MNTFRTEFNTRLHKTPVLPSSRILTLGSCFADTIGNKLSDNKILTSINPFGTTYNPLSIHRLIRMVIHNQMPAPHTYLYQEGVHSNDHFHSSFSSLNKKELEMKIEEAIRGTHLFLKHCHFLFLTYGTSFVFEREETKEIVANCHKRPSALFRKKLLEQPAIERSFEEMYQELRKFNPNLRIILTVSPVRHLKETMELNSVSKSILRVACHSMTIAHHEVDYFPAFEILMDDLRDYRFYASDMIHPSTDAENYIWEKFSESYFSIETRATLNEWQRIKKMLHHRPFHTESESHKKLIKDIRTKLEALHQKLDVSQELNQYL